MIKNNKRGFIVGFGSGMLVVSILALAGHLSMISAFRNAETSLPDGQELVQPEMYVTLENGNIRIDITEDDTSMDVAEKMYNAGLIEDTVDFKCYLDARALYLTYKPGTYEFAKDITYDEILGVMSR